MGDFDLVSKARADFQPHVLVEHKERWGYWDGITYAGLGLVDDTRVWYTYAHDVETGRGPWERFELGDLGRSNDPSYMDYLEVSRNIHGFKVYAVYTLLPEHCTLINAYHDVEHRYTHVPRNDAGAIDKEAWRERLERVKRVRVAEGCDYDIIKTLVFKRDPARLLGYFFEDGMECSEEHYFNGPRSKLLTLSQEMQDFCAAAALVED